MKRSFFLAIGITLLLFGLQSMALEKVVLKMKDDLPPPISKSDTGPRVAPNVELTPPAWCPYSLVTTGTVVCIYCFTLPKRFGK